MIDPEDCEIIENHIPGEEYSIMLLYDGIGVAIAELSVTNDFTIDGKVYEGMYFHRLKVLENYRGYGLGSYTLDLVLEFAEEEHMPIINEVNPYGELDLGQLREFYMRHGFTEVTERTLYFKPD